jgi:hypothetical protein
LRNINKPWPRFEFKDLGRDTATLDALPTVPEYWGFRCRFPNTDNADKANVPQKTMAKYFDYITYKMFGHIGTTAAVKIMTRELAYSVHNESKVWSGPFKYAPLFRTVLQQLSVSSEVAKTIVGQVPSVTNYSSSQMVALALQSAYRVWASRKCIMETIEELFIAMEELKQGKSILTRDTYCECSEEQKLTKWHYCMYCLRLQACRKLVWTADDRLLCESHFIHGPPPPSRWTRNRIHQLASRPRPGEPITKDQRDAMVTELTDEKWLPESGIYRDAFDGRRPLETTPSHPYTMSIDAVFPLYKEGNKAFVHHAINVVLTTGFLNGLKRIDLPALLLAFKHAVTQTADGKYLPDIELAIDHLFTLN